MIAAGELGTLEWDGVTGVDAGASGQGTSNPLGISNTGCHVRSGTSRVH